jgi:hypothetical protein
MSTILMYAAGVTTILSLLAFLGGLYAWLQSQKRERSLVDIVKGEGIVQGESVVGILEQFESDDARLNALQHVLGYSKDRAADVLLKVKPNVDVGKLFRVNELQLQRRFLITGLVLIILAGLAVLASRRGTKTDADLRIPTSHAPEAEVTTKVVLITWVSDGNFVMLDDKKYRLSVNAVGPNDALVSYSEMTKQTYGTFRVTPGQRLTVPTSGGEYYIDIRQIHDKQVLIEVTRRLIPQPSQK